MIEFLNGNALHIPLVDRSVQCIITSPPYWGLRDYGTAKWIGGDLNCEHRVGNQVQDNKAPSAIVSGVRPGTDTSQCVKCRAIRIDSQLGLERIPDCLGWARGENCGKCYVCHMRLVAMECWRILRDDGVMWWNCGDSYMGGKGTSGAADPDTQAERYENGETLTRPASQSTGGNGKLRPSDDLKTLRLSGLKPKDLVGIPWRVALAFQADGWYLRMDNIWSKPNPMPESVADRPTKSHEYVFLLSKSKRYYYDATAIMETLLSPPHAPGNKVIATGKTDRGHLENRIWGAASGRNHRSVWEVATHPYRGAHFATFPEKLIEPMILSGSSPIACEVCRAPWERDIERVAQYEKRQGRSQPSGVMPQVDSSGWNPAIVTDNGWTPTCNCSNNTGSGKCLVLDPFSGTATVGKVAIRHGRDFIGLELNLKYIDLARERVGETQTVMLE